MASNTVKGAAGFVLIFVGVFFVCFVTATIWSYVWSSMGSESKENTMATKISVSVGRTFNLGNYESLRLDEGMEIELEDGESAKEARIVLLETLEAQVEKDAAIIAKRIKARK